jgi:trehalose 2-sulfotransferase
MGGFFHNLRHPRRCYVVCTIPRSGSNLLTDGLRATRRAGVPKQFFLPKFEARYGAELGLDPLADYSGYVQGIVNSKASHNEVFGFKLMSWYLDDFLTRLRNTRALGDAATGDLTLLRNAFPRLRFVHIRRRHKLRQALSTARALQTGLWKVQEGKTTEREPQFDAELIEQSLKEAQRQEEIWHCFFQRIGIEPFEVEYEKLCHDYEGTIRSVLDFLHISLPRGARIGPPVTIRQADEISRIWEERFLTERPSAYSPAAVLKTHA